MYRQVSGQHAAGVKHKAAAVVVGTAGLLKVRQDAAVKLVHMVQPFFLHQQCCLFTADAAGAKTHHGLALQLGTVGAQRGRKLRELV